MMKAYPKERALSRQESFIGWARRTKAFVRAGKVVYGWTKGGTMTGTSWVMSSFIADSQGSLSSTTDYSSRQGQYRTPSIRGSLILRSPAQQL